MKGLTDRNGMKRREFLTTAPVATLVPVSPAHTSVNSSASRLDLRSLYFEWQGVKAHYDRVFDKGDLAAETAVFDHMLAIEQFVSELQPVSVEEMAFKIIFADDDGDMAMNIHQVALVQQAYALVGIVDRHGMRGFA